MSAEVNSEYVRLERAQLCADCDAVFNVARERCPSCDSGSALPLALCLSNRSELVEGLRALSKLMAWAKRPERRRAVVVTKPHEIHNETCGCSHHSAVVIVQNTKPAAEAAKGEPDEPVHP